jgi:predicted ATP-dependent protease
MLKTLGTQDLTLAIDSESLGFGDTSQLAALSADKPAWIGQPEAERAASFGLNLQQPGFHLLVLGEPGSGRTSLLQQLMQQTAAQQPSAPDIVYLHNFAVPERPLALFIEAGAGAELRAALDQLVRQLARTVPALLHEAMARLPETGRGEFTVEKIVTEQAGQAIASFIDEQLAKLERGIRPELLQRSEFGEFLRALRNDVLENLDAFQPGAGSEADEAMESVLSRYRANLLVDNRRGQGAPAIYDNDPSFQSLFGGMEAAGDHAVGDADFLRLRAGNLLRANGGMLMLHLRDLQADQHSGSQILEKLQRFMRNNSVQIEEPAAASGHGTASHLALEALPVEAKLILIATRDEYYQLYEDAPDFFSYFRIKVDFTDSFTATAEANRAIAQYIAERCEQFGIPHFDAPAVTLLLRVMQRWIDDRTRYSTDFGRLQSLLLECAAVAQMRGAALVTVQDIEAALAARYERHQYPEQQLRDCIVENELIIRLHGREIGQINGISHIDLGDASFGSPVRISARCYAGEDGIVNVGREVELSGPNHDKGIFILQSWLSATFARQTPLALTASLVFEQEYHGVEGDSASCAELYALLSALSGLPLPQGIAVTGALNQHGEVMPVGGINEKIEGYFRVCRRLGLDGSQGVIIPAANRRHLVLHDEVLQAVAQGMFHIHTMSHVLDGIEHLTGMLVGAADENGNYRPETVLGRVQRTLEIFQRNCKGPRQFVRHLGHGDSRL